MKSIFLMSDGSKLIRNFSDIKKGKFYLIVTELYTTHGIAQSVMKDDRDIGLHHTFIRKNGTYTNVTINGWRLCEVYECTLH